MLGEVVCRGDVIKMLCLKDLEMIKIREVEEAQNMAGTIRKMTYKGEVEIEVPEMAMVRLCTHTQDTHIHNTHTHTHVYTMTHSNSLE